MDLKQYTEFSVSQTVRLLGAESPTGFPFAAQDVLMKELRA